MKILNLYSGVGGNSNLWDDNQHEIVNVEYDPKISAILQKRKPKQVHLVTDAHQFLLENHQKFDFIWSSPPCQSHSKMNKFTRHNTIRYPDGKLFEEIIFLQHRFKGNWVVENVVPYYDIILNPKKIGRHLFWSNFNIPDIEMPTPPNFINLANLKGKQIMMDWLGIHYEENIYYGTNHCPVQILRNCVHPSIGLEILNSLNRLTPSLKFDKDEKDKGRNTGKPNNISLFG